MIRCASNLGLAIILLSAGGCLRAGFGVNQVNDDAGIPDLALDSAGDIAPEAGTDATIGDAGIEAIAVVAVSAAAPNWNDYVDANNTDTPCAPATGAACLHLGMRRHALVTADDCEGITAKDTLAVFHWDCQASEQVGFVDIVSDGFQGEGGLRDLVTTSGWKANTLMVSRNGVVIAQSTPGAWWDNPVAPLPANPGTAGLPLSGPGTIYVADADTDTAGYTFAEPGIAIVTLGDAVLRHNGVGGGATMIEIIGRARAWVEATVNAQGPPPGLVKASTGIFMEDAQYSTVWQTKIINAAGNGIHMKDADRNLFYRVTIANSSVGGMFVITSRHNVLYQVRSYNNGNNGVWLSLLSNDSNVVGLLTASNQGPGLKVADVNTACNVVHMTSGANARGMQMTQAGNELTMVGGLLVGNDTNGFEATEFNGASSIDEFIADTFILNNASRAIFLEKSSTNTFSGFIGIGPGSPSSDCLVTGAGVDPGLVGPVCDNQGASTAVWVRGIDAENTLVGAQGDGANGSADPSGTAMYDQIEDWTTFDSPYRSWGNILGAGSSLAPARRCAPGSQCQIYDWRIVAAPANPLWRTAGKGSAADTPLVNGAQCPETVDGDTAITDQRTNDANTFLPHAIEIIGDSRGDDDGLCESNERCIYAPNAGAFLGEGDARSQTCTFVNGTVTNVIMHGYPVTGK